MYIQRDEAGKRNKKKSWKKEPMKVWMNTVYRSLMQRDMKAMHCFRTTTVLFSSGRGRFPVPLLILLALSIAFVSSLASEVQSDDIQPNTRPVYSAQQQQQQQHKAPTHHHNDRGGSRGDPVGSTPLSSSGSNAQSDGSPPKLSSSSTSSQTGSTVSSSQQQQPSPPSHPSSRMLETRNSYAVLSQAMSQAVHHEFDFLFLISGTYGSGSADGACSLDDLDCIAHHDHLGMEAIRSLHRQLDDDDNGDIDLSESDDFLREELKYDSGYEKRHKAFHFNDDMHISVKELWEAWLRSEVHNWTVDQTTEWLAQSVQLPQYVHLFRQHKVTGKVLPRLAVNNMHYVSNVLGIKDPIHKQKIALKAMDAVLFGPPRETGTRWKDLLLVTLLLTAIIGSWYAYQQNKNAKIHLKRMAKDVEGLLKAEVALKDMQKELERARLEQENVGKEKMDLERRLREAPSLTSSNSDLELQQLKQEIEMLRSELSRAEVEINDHCWTPPQGLQNWLQLTYELENKQHIRKRIVAEKQLMSAREACEKLKKKRSSLVGAFVSTHGKSIDDVDRSIVEARNALNDVTNELQERMFRWRQIEQLLGFSIANNNGLPYLENLLYNRNGGGSKSYRSSRLSSSQDDLDDDSVQAYIQWSDPQALTWCPWNPQRYLFHRQLQALHREYSSSASLMAATFPSTTTTNNNNTSNSSSNSNLLSNFRRSRHSRHRGTVASLPAVLSSEEEEQQQGSLQPLLGRSSTPTRPIRPPSMGETSNDDDGGCTFPSGRSSARPRRPNEEGGRLDDDSDERLAKATTKKKKRRKEATKERKQQRKGDDDDRQMQFRRNEERRSSSI
ncbi:stromal interaction molecule homolog isoform X4 [Toxorhynchites rutilus septentrionalis]|uniref:stromal interaction molecule homolog isoform X4 n=1 Tax=Toxorhynchites rutilus septentrionalis TaxID=329112 RepID=UPI0024791D98|nr:stromal interaction molecule homolog isoform X4 [Toxorhynchites rutilus septentrionalis]